MSGLGKTKIGIIGAGKMGQALIKGLRSQGVSGKQIIVTDVLAKARTSTRRSFPVTVVDSIQSVLKSADVVILAIKPQQFPEVAEILSALVSRRILFVSIAAGITTQWLAKRLPGIPVARVMPNLPATLGLGFSAIAFSKSVNARERKITKAIFEAAGQAVEMPERYFDAITAVSGSGPAYVFFLVHAWQEAALRLGLPAAVAEGAIRQTLKGSLALLTESRDTPEALIAKVASKGGTTEAALKTLYQRRVLESFGDALKAAAKRSRELSWG